MKKIIVLTFCLVVFCLKELVAQNLQELATGDMPYLEALYKDLHSHPELSFRERETARKMARELKEAGFEVTTNYGGYGVVGILRNGPGPVIMVRTDMDALPMVEETGWPFASNVRQVDVDSIEMPVMHACGHDVHMTVWTGTARLLAKLKENWSGTLLFIAQPAEERGGGSKLMLEKGLYRDFPVPDYALAFHVKGSVPAGSIAYVPGYALANVDMVDITVHGRGSHGAMPERSIDPIVLSARIILALQTIVSREISPLEPAVVTVGSIHGGTKHNIIPDDVKMQLTLRSYNIDVRNQIINAIQRICNGIAASAGVDPENYPEVKLADEFTPSTYNDPGLTERARKALIPLLGEEHVIPYKPVMGGEDFSRYGLTEEKVPICLLWLGVANPGELEKAREEGRQLPDIHNNHFTPDYQEAIPVGVAGMAAILLNLMKN